MSRIIRLTSYWVVLVALAGCSSALIRPTEETNLPNPASVFCEENNGVLEIRQDTDGNQFGACIFKDGSECEEWAFYRGECAPGDGKAAPSEPAAKPTPSEERAPAGEPTPAGVPTPELASDGCLIYRNETLGYSFHYPAGSSVIQNDEPAKSFSIVGPVVDGETWPYYTISHPADRAEFRPPEGVDLEQWLSEHYLVGENRQPDLTIADVPAIHYRHERSPQSYADDRYYFAYKGQLYMILIGHSGDKEDWELYNHFLESFQFGPD